MHSRYTWLFLFFIAALILIPFRPAQAPAQDKDPWKDMDVQWGGRFKLQGSVSWPDKRGYLQPVGTKPLYDGTGQFRLKYDVNAADLIKLEVHYETAATAGQTKQKMRELKRRLPELFTDGGLGTKTIDDDRRLVDLTWTIAEKDSYIWYHRLDRLNLTIPAERGFLRLGRQAVTWGNGMLFNPMDMFNPFAPTDIDRDYKVGDDIAFAQIDLSDYGNFQMLYVPRRDPDDHKVKWSESSLAGKVHLFWGTTEFDVMGGMHYNDWVIGGGVTGYLGQAAYRVDATWTFLQNVDWIYAYSNTWSFVDKNMKSKDGYPAVVANIDYSWVWFGLNFYGYIEYYYQGIGHPDPLDSLRDKDLLEKMDRGEIFFLGQSYGSGHIMLELHPLVKLYLTNITNLYDYSGTIQPRLVWDVTQDIQATLGSNLVYGYRGTEFGGYTLPGTNLRSKGPNSLYVWLAYYF